MPTTRIHLLRKALLVVLAGSAASAVNAQTHGNHNHERLHFSHPLIAENPSPDTKLRGDYFFRDAPFSDFHSTALVGEYAFAPWISVEASLPFTVNDTAAGPTRSSLDNGEVALKLANTSFGPSGLLLGGGLELGLPTGNDEKGIGSDEEIEIEPFLDFGYKTGKLELVGFLKFGIPTNQPAGETEAVDLEIGYNTSLLYHITPQVSGLVELDGETIAAGTEDETIANVTPALKVQPLAEVPLKMGAGVSFPVSDDEAFDVRGVFSVFYHF